MWVLVIMVGGQGKAVDTAANILYKIYKVSAVSCPPPEAGGGRLLLTRPSLLVSGRSLSLVDWGQVKQGSGGKEGCG